MRNSALIASATLALLLVPALSAAQEPHWIFEVPVNLQTLNQEVDHVRVSCRTFDHPAQDIYQTPIGRGESDDVQPDAAGNISRTVQVPTNAGFDGSEPGEATHYICQLRLFVDGKPMTASSTSDLIWRQPKAGTQLVSEVAGSLP